MESRSRKIFTTINILLIIILIILVFIVTGYTKNTKKLNNEIKKLKTLIIKVDEKDYSSEIKFYENIDDEISKKYDEYYDNIEKLEKKVRNKETDIKIAYLTFDDGPYNLTPKVLDVLKENNIRATFFVLGKTKYENIYKRIVDEGHTLANHTYYHNITKGLYSSADSFVSQVTKLEDYLYSVTGKKTTLVRFPGGSPQAGKLKESIVNKLHDKGYNYVDWTCETGDGSGAKLKQKDPYSWYKDTCKQDIVVLLMHDYNESTYTNLQKIIDDLKKRNYIFLPLTNKSEMAK